MSASLLIIKSFAAQNFAAQGLLTARGDFDVTIAVAVAILGLAVGSFLNVCIHRVPRQASIVRPGSSCPHCGYVLRWYDNIPVVSYALLLGGRCRQCKAGISIRYPIVEIITMAVFVLHYLILGADIILIPRLLFASALIVLFAIDLEHHLLPNVITLPGIVVGLAFSTMTPPGLIDALIGALAGGGVLWLLGEAYYRYSGQEGMGGGDVKMLAMIGAFLGWKLVLLTLILSSLLGSIVGVLMLVFRKGGLKSALPYGTFLALAALFSSLVGDPLVSWYLGFYQ
jgi:leader peptidase (prepilin peptidase)/N-methyltransferase